MAADLIELAKGAVSPSAREGLNGILGTSADQTDRLFESAAGLVLEGLKARSDSIDGADEIHRTARDQDFGLIDRLGSILPDESRVSSFQKSGSKILESVFGDRTQTVALDFAQTSGLDQSSATTLLRIAAPVVMGIVARVVSRQSLNGPGLASLLASQPSRPVDPVRTHRHTSASRPESSGERTPVSADPKSNGNGSIMKLVAVFCAGAVLAAGIFWYLNRVENPASDTGTPSSTGTIPEPAGTGNSTDATTNPPVTVPEKEGFDLEKVIEKFGSIAAGFRNINAGNAKEFADRLTGLGESLDSLGLDRLKGMSRTLFSIAAKKFLGELDLLLEKHQNDQVDSVIRPAIQKVKDKLAENGF